MKVIIAGSRNFEDYGVLKKAVQDSGFDVTEVVSGKARGVDTIGERYAKEHGLPIKEFPANWTLHGKAAGPIRNAQMAEYGEALIALPMGESRGTRNMIEEATKRNLKIFVVEV